MDIKPFVQPVKVDASGRMAVPRALARVLNIRPGDKMEVFVMGKDVVYRKADKQ